LSVNGLVTVYQIPPDSQTTVGVDLGEPIRTYKPESLLQKGSIAPVIISETRIKSIATSATKRKKFKISRDEYLQLRLSGVSRDAVAERNNISISTLRHYLSDWELGKPEQEAAAMKELSQ
jgi:hypothetical protein